MTITSWDSSRDEARFIGACFEYFGPMGRNIDRLFRLLDSGVDETWFQDPRYRDLYLGLFQVVTCIGQEGVTVRVQGILDAAEARTHDKGWAREAMRSCMEASGYLVFDDLLNVEIPLWWQKLKRPKLVSLLGSIDQQITTMPPSPDRMATIESLIEQVTEQWQAEPAVRRSELGLLERTRAKALAPRPLDSRISTGLLTLDQVLGGGLSGPSAPDSGRLIVVCARPAMGKTQVAVNLAMRVAAAGSSVAFWSLEMQDEQIALRMLAAWDYATRRASGRPLIGGPLTYSMLRSHDISGDARKRLEGETYAAIDANLTVFNGGSSLTPETLCHQMRLFCRRRPDTRLFVIDHLGLLAIPDNSNRAVAVGEATRLIKTTAVSLGVDVALLAQLNRGVENRGDKMPTMGDLRDSGRIEEDADVILGLHRPAYYNVGDPSLVGRLEIGVLKNRQGGSGTFLTQIDLDCCAVSDDPSFLAQVAG
jgi:replicative DNA helicase